MLVYVAGPYSSDPERCVRAAIDAGHALMDAGLLAVVPHLSHYARPRPYEDWLALDLALVERCDALVRLPGASPGADREVSRALACGLPVVSLDEALARWGRR